MDEVQLRGKVHQTSEHLEMDHLFHKEIGQSIVVVLTELACLWVKVPGLVQHLCQKGQVLDYHAQRMVDQMIVMDPFEA